MSKLPVLPSDEEFRTLKVFPFPESRMIEVKHSISCYKIVPTLCGFLNGSGGHFICGVENTTYKINWTPMTIEDIDNFNLIIDDIYHRQVIYSTEGHPLHPTALQTRFINNGKDEYIVVVTAIPEKNTKYRTKTNNWYRLNASNYCTKAPKMIATNYWSHLKTIDKQDALIKKLTIELTHAKREIQEYQSIINEKEAPIQKLMNELTLAKCEIQDYQSFINKTFNDN
jgi:predicted HTH transcriptional regulator